MNRLAKLTAGIALAMAFTLTACEGGDSPKSLAKQGYENFQEAMKLTKEGAKPDDPRFAKIEEKTKALEEKTKLLSEEDKKILQDEFTRLEKEGK